MEASGDGGGRARPPGRRRLLIDEPIDSLAPHNSGSTPEHQEMIAESS